MTTKLRLGVNIDHVATVRNARGGEHPCPVRAALLAYEAGADGITAHLREDRRHIRDADIERLRAEVPLPLNFEMAATPEMLAIALKIKPHAVCLVPEKREELTTEGGLDVAKLETKLTPFVAQLQDAGCRVSLFIAAVDAQLEAAARTGARVVELHTGAYAEGHEDARAIATGAARASALGLEVHAGHGLNYANVDAIAAIPQIVELNIGHFLMGEALFVGLKDALAQMRRIMDNARVTSQLAGKP
jgi:pyridoxine 5-phosphate synthase